MSVSGSELVCIIGNISLEKGTQLQVLELVSSLTSQILTNYNELPMHHPKLQL